MDTWVLVTWKGEKKEGREERKGKEANGEKYYEPRIIINQILCI